MKRQGFKHIVFGLLGLLFCSSLWAQVPNLKFDHYIDDRGLTQNTVVDIVQDGDGFIWLATPNGLFKFDGQRFVVYRNNPNSDNSPINNYIKCLELDGNNNLWIGTVNGLSKFNFITQSFTTSPAILRGKNITTIFSDSSGKLWVGTQKSGLYHFPNPEGDDLTYEHYGFQLGQHGQISHNEILSITQDQAGQIWVGTKKGLNRFHAEDRKSGFDQFRNLKESIKSLYVDQKGRLWIGASKDKLLCLNDPENQKPNTILTFKQYPLGEGLSDAKDWGVVSFEEDPEGYLWIAAKGYGLYWLDPSTDMVKRYQHNPWIAESLSTNRTMAVLLDRTNVLWVGTEIGGVNRSDLNRKKIEFMGHSPLNRNSLTNPSVNAIYEDEPGNLWVGTENGLNKINFDEKEYLLPRVQRYVYSDNPSETGKGIQRIRSIIRDSDGDYWLGGDRITHMELDPVTQKPKFQPTDLDMSDVFSILEDHRGNLWFGSFSQGLVKWKKKRKAGSREFDFSTAERYTANEDGSSSISDNLISSLFEDSKGRLWVGTLQGGLNLLVRGSQGERDHFISYQNNPKDSLSLSHNSVFSIHEDKNGIFWIGTFGGGLNKMVLDSEQDLNPRFKSFREKDGLANDAIYGILEDDKGILWMSSDNGISSFDTQKEEFKNFNKGDGLQSNNFRKNAYFRNKEGYLFFGGLRGLNIFHPDDLQDNKLPAQPKLTSFKVKNEEVKVGEEYNGRVLMEKQLASLEKLVLEHHENTLTFEFAALHFAAPENNQFEHQLIGFDSDWVNSNGLPFAHYTNLPPGEYTFNVRVSNNDGLWNPTPASINLEVLPPFWLSTWAYLLYGLLLLGVFLSVRSYYLLKNKERVAVKIQKEMEVVNRLKLQFFTNISHDFKTNITLIINPLEEILDSFQVDTSLKPKLRVIQRNANALLRLVNQLMEFRKIEVGETKLVAAQGNIVHFVREITFSFQAVAKKKQIELSFESQLYATKVWFDWDKLEKILKNIISNAVKFTQEDGKVVVKVSKSNPGELLEIAERDTSGKYVVIEVEDNGPGISESQLPYVFQRFYQVDKSKKSSVIGSGIGLAITKDLVDLHHGQIDVESEEGNGARFILKLPLGDAHLLPEEKRQLTPDEHFEEEEVDEIGIALVDEEGPMESQMENEEVTILVVDDNADIRELVKNGLSKYKVLEAADGKEALYIAQKEVPDLIVSDVLMPEMDGIDFCQQIKTNIRTSHIPIILLTALNSVEHRIEGLESGADAYIPKPFKMKLLLVRVEKLMESRERIRKHFLSEEHLTPEHIELNSLDKSFLEKIMALMEEHMDDESYQVDQLAFDMNTSRSTFFRKLKKLTGQAPNDFIRMVRLKRAAQLLSQNQLTVAEVSYLVGFSDSNYFGKCFRKVFGVPPSQYAAKGSKVI